jgi:hypothetical protein
MVGLFFVTSQQQTAPRRPQERVLLNHQARFPQPLSAHFVPQFIA